MDVQYKLKMVIMMEKHWPLRANAFLATFLNLQHIPLLSAWNLKQTLESAFCYPQARINRIVEQILKRHKLRQDDINRYYPET